MSTVPVAKAEELLAMKVLSMTEELGGMNAAKVTTQRDCPREKGND